MGSALTKPLFDPIFLQKLQTLKLLFCKNRSRLERASEKDDDYMSCKTSFKLSKFNGPSILGNGRGSNQTDLWLVRREEEGVKWQLRWLNCTDSNLSIKSRGLTRTKIRFRAYLLACLLAYLSKEGAERRWPYNQCDQMWRNCTIWSKCSVFGCFWWVNLVFGKIIEPTLANF